LFCSKYSSHSISKLGDGLDIIFVPIRRYGDVNTLKLRGTPWGAFTDRNVNNEFISSYSKKLDILDTGVPL